MAQNLTAQERIYKTYDASFEEIYFSDKDDMFKNFLYLFTYVGGGLGLVFILFLKGNQQFYYFGIALLYTALISSLAIFIGLIFSKNNFKSDSLVPNVKSKKNTYMLNFGYEVKEHLGDAPKSMKNKSNLTGRVLLRSAEKIKRMGIVVGKAGSGKTVFLRGLLEEILFLGAGAFVIDAKGTVDEIKRFLAMAYKYGRENDLLILNFTNMKNTHTINFLAYGSALMLKEILMVLSSSGEDKWRQVDEDFITAILKLLVYKRDNEKLILTLDVIRDYLTLSRLLKEAIKYRKSQHRNLDDYVRYVTSKIEIDAQEFKAKADGDVEFWKLCSENAKKTDLQGVYEAGLSAGNWNGVLTTLGSDYGAIFNVEYPDIDFYQAIQSNKIILVSLPTMESEETAKKIGKLLLGIIKSVADTKIRSSAEPRIPFVFLLDEFGSFAISGFGRFMSKARALGMPMFLFFQSTAQIDVVDDGKGLEKQEIFDNSDVFCCLKNTDSDLAEYINKTLPERVYLDRSYKEMKKHVSGSNSSPMSSEADYQKEKEEAIKTEYFAKQNNGEMYLCSGAEAFKCVSKAPEDIDLTYKLKDLKATIPLRQLIPKEKLRVIFGGKKRNLIFSKSCSYNISVA